MRRAYGLQSFDLAKKKAKHVEHVNRRFIKKATSDFLITDPFRIKQLSTIHLHMCRMRLMSLRQHSLQLRIYRREATVMSDLKNFATLFRCLFYAPSIGEGCRHRFFAKDGRIACQCPRNLQPLSLTAAEVRSIFNQLCIKSTGKRPHDVIDRRDLNAVITRQNRCVYSGDIAGAEKSDFEFGHLWHMSVASVPPASAGGQTLNARAAAWTHLLTSAVLTSRHSILSQQQPLLLAPAQTDRAPNTQAGRFPRSRSHHNQSAAMLR